MKGEEDGWDKRLDSINIHHSYFIRNRITIWYTGSIYLCNLCILALFKIIVCLVPMISFLSNIKKKDKAKKIEENSFQIIVPDNGSNYESSWENVD